MLKRFFELLGLVTMGVGVYIIESNQKQNQACNVLQAHYRALGVSATCQHVVWTYFGGFLLLALGVIVVLFGLLSTRRAIKRRSKNRNPSLASQFRPVDHAGRGPTN
jgi:K+-transporting ATPase A subunit